METEDLRWCIKILEDLINRPCAKPFINPIDDTEPGYENYYKRIKSPVFLSTIQEKLLTNEYTDIEDMNHDISILVKNTERYHGKTDVRTAMAHGMQKYFYRLFQEKALLNSKNWISRVTELQEKVDNLVQNAPPVLKEKCKTTITIPPFPSLKVHEVEKIMKMAEKLTEKKDVHRMLEIIVNNHREILITAKDMEIDISRLNNVTLNLLKNYIDKRFFELGLDSLE